MRLGPDFEIHPAADGYDWVQGANRLQSLPAPGIPGAPQTDNLACALAAVTHLQDRLPVPPTRLRQAIADTRLAGRLQRLASRPEIWVDVGHNPDAVGVLARHLRGEVIAGRTHAVVGMLRDKAVEASLTQLHGLVDCWHPVRLPGSRAMAPDQLAALLRRLFGPRRVEPELEPAAALQAALDACGPEDRVLVFGSFLTVATALRNSVLRPVLDGATGDSLAARR